MLHVRPLVIAVAATAVVGCGRTEDTAPPVATPAVKLARSAAAVGTPLEMHYQFGVAPDAPAFAEDYWVFVHFLDVDGELLWTDDHQPPTPTRSWKPGSTIEYSRTMFVPKFPYTGSTTVQLGLFSPRTGERLPLSGETSGQRAYQVASFDLQPQKDNYFVIFREGWHSTEVADDQLGTEWQWTKQEASLSFRNPKRNVTVYLQLDQPVAPFADPQQVEVRLGDAVVDRFPLPAGETELRKFPLTAAQLGSDETAELTIAVDRTFVPANTPSLKSNDPRELGVRVFRAHIEPQ